MKIKFLVKKLSKNAKIPLRKSEGAAGYDLSSAYNYTIPKRGKIIVKTDLAMSIPKGYYGRVASKSGLSLYHSIEVGAGVIDIDFRGNVGVILYNHSNEDFKIAKGDRIAQLILTKIVTCKVEEVEELDDTSRGVNGFGSTKDKGEEDEKDEEVEEIEEVEKKGGTNTPTLWKFFGFS